jgi:hypothetical protein
VRAVCIVLGINLFGWIMGSRNLVMLMGIILMIIVLLVSSLYSDASMAFLTVCCSSSWYLLIQMEVRE